MSTARTATPTPAPAPTPTPLAGVATVGELLSRLGNVPARRVRLRPTPGTATEKDVIRALDKENRPCELVEGTLVEKVLGYAKSVIGGLIGTSLNNFVRPRKLGIVTGADGAVRLFPGLVRIPDVAFASWARFPGGRLPKAAIPTVAPDLAVEVISKRNTKAEIARKLGEYFRAGVRLVWIVEPKTLTVRVYTAADRFTVLKPGQVLDGGDVLPGFTVRVDELFPGD